LARTAFVPETARSLRAAIAVEPPSRSAVFKPIVLSPVIRPAPAAGIEIPAGPAAGHGAIERRVPAVAAARSVVPVTFAWPILIKVSHARAAIRTRLVGLCLGNSGQRSDHESEAGEPEHDASEW